MPSPHDTPVAVGMYSFFSSDPQRLAGFWAALMDLPIAEGASDELVMLDFNHEVGPMTWIFERRDDVAKGAAPLALDLGINDQDRWADAADRAEALGATRVAEHHENGVRWIEMLDPDQNRFRIFAPRPE